MIRDTRGRRSMSRVNGACWMTVCVHAFIGKRCQLAVSFLFPSDAGILFSRYKLSPLWEDARKGKAMNVSFIWPEKQLSPYVALIWVFESRFGVPLADSRLIVPDGRAKIIVPYRNSLCAAVNKRLLNAKEHHIFLVGIQTHPTTIASTATDTSTIGVELTPKGLYHLFKLSMHEITNRMVSFEELFGPPGARLQNRVGDVEDPKAKIALLQTALTHLLQQNDKEYALLDHTLDLLAQTHGMMRVQELAVHLGYTKRYLDRLFQEHVGVSPKSLASILRFQEVYQGWMQHQSSTFFRYQWPAYYYDQSHFIKEFKRFTGFTPQQYTAIVNEFGRAFSASP
jgi:AraC-like DNA-binding protein